MGALIGPTVGMQAFLAVAAGGAVGAMLRHGVNLLVVLRLGASPFWATFLVNVLGSAVMGMLLLLFAERWPEQSVLRLMLTTGLLGALTTFSTFSVESLQMLLDQRYGLALGYVMASVLTCIAAAALGVSLGRYFLRIF